MIWLAKSNHFIPGLWRHILELQRNYIDDKHGSKHKIVPSYSPALDLIGTKFKVIYWKLYKFQHQQCHKYASWDVRTSLMLIEQRAIDICSHFKACRETCLQSFQYSIIHRILACNALLYVRKVETTNHYQYVYCINTNLDDISHYLVTCPPVSIHWESCVTWLKSLKYSKLNPLAEDNIILGFSVETNEK